MTNGVVQLGFGNDTLTLANGSNSVSVSGVQTVYGGTGADVITSTGFGASITMYGGAGNDVLTGWIYGDKLYGGDGNDTLNGGDGFDTLYGEAGNDTMISGSGGARMIGGAGINTANGGSGNDYFTFISASGSDRMVVSGMSNHDTIELDTNRSNTMTGNTFTLSQNLADNVNIKAVSSASAFNAVNFGQAGFVYRQDTGGLYYDADGKFSSGSVLIGTITGTSGNPWNYDFDDIKQV
jgi:Ca2+-binding RTX toxin-like protein